MSELNVFGLREYSRRDLFEDTTDEIREADRFYIMHEADEVILELKEIDSKNRSAYYKDLSMMAKDVEHHKYKRCLAMAAVCFEKSYSTTLVKYDKKSGLCRNFYDWWGKRWLKIAEQFKETK